MPSSPSAVRILKGLVARFQQQGVAWWQLLRQVCYTGDFAVPGCPVCVAGQQRVSGNEAHCRCIRGLRCAGGSWGSSGRQSVQGEREVLPLRGAHRLPSAWLMVLCCVRFVAGEGALGRQLPYGSC